MADFEKIITSVPVNAQAAKQMARGEVFEPRKRLNDILPSGIKVKKVEASVLLNPLFVDFTGKKFGRLTVLGLLPAKPKGAGRKGTKSATWVCRCACGNFVGRATKSLKVALSGGSSFRDRCDECDYLRWITSSEYLAKGR